MLHNFPKVSILQQCNNIIIFIVPTRRKRKRCRPTTPAPTPITLQAISTGSTNINTNKSTSTILMWRWCPPSFYKPKPSKNLSRSTISPSAKPTRKASPIDSHSSSLPQEINILPLFFKKNNQNPKELKPQPTQSSTLLNLPLNQPTPSPLKPPPNLKLTATITIFQLLMLTSIYQKITTLFLLPYSRKDKNLKLY